MAEADMLIVLGGGYIYAERGLRGVLFLLRVLYPAILGLGLRKAVVFLAHSVGPFHNPFAGKIAQIVLSRASILVVRDEATVQMLTDLGVERPVVVRAPDFAFFLGAADRVIGQRILSAKGVSDKGPMFGFAIRAWRFEAAPNTVQLQNRYIDTMAHLADHLVRKYGGIVVFVPQCTGPSDYEDDRIIADEVYSRAQEQGSLVVLNDELNVEELASLYSNFDFVVATRCHAAILSAVSGVPFVAISYRGGKTYGVIRDLALEDMIIDIDRIDLAELAFMVDQGMTQRDRISRKLRRRVDAMRKFIQEFTKELVMSLSDAGRLEAFPRERGSDFIHWEDWKV